MRNKINALPIILDRKVTIYTGCGDDPLFHFYDCDSDDNVVLCSDGTNVEYWLSFIFDERRSPLSNLQIELNPTVAEFMEWTQGEDTYVDLVLISPNKVNVFITTQSDVIYNEVHTIR